MQKTVTKEQIRRILEASSGDVFDQASEACGKLEGLAMKLTPRDGNLRRELISAIADSYNAAITEAYTLGFERALDLTGIYPSEDRVERYIKVVQYVDRLDGDCTGARV